MVNTIRDGQKVWPYCTECGCRLMLYPHDDEWTWVTHYGEGQSWFTLERDARGCICSLVNKASWIKTSLVEHIVGV
jgi:hypothetical protein